MKSLSWHFVDKSDWTDGPWQNEPDKKQWVDPKTGLPCLIVRAPTTGSLCGYVGVPEGHPWYEKDSVDADVHGGVTFTGKCTEKEHGICHIVETGEDDAVWWVGFDCAHAFDHCPAIESLLKKNGYDGGDGGDGFVYRDEVYVEEMTRLLAIQAVLATKGEKERE